MTSGHVQGGEECYDKVQTIVQDKPTEECTIEPQRTCRHVTKLVPKLTPTEECVDVPKEICTRYLALLSPPLFFLGFFSGCLKIKGTEKIERR